MLYLKYSAPPHAASGRTVTVVLLGMSRGWPDSPAPSSYQGPSQQQPPQTRTQYDKHAPQRHLAAQCRLLI